ncbi:ATP-binding cassette domain-containing protein [Rhodococcus opacus]|uniref:ATP-binding cassette domain-containing protein n=1 Tax=Rhodococcus opacus TaxID=37919 RepID=A0AAX3YU21_RHOOP|nr:MULTISPECIES: ATP-binding cassette domain-containing protein [Rhodococcus]MCZ4588804.1 ATP-binding cassette domain-containing protein [Rhodococcus opacus]QSE85994.1 ATP-binding cassette domain-containing protein [Rhodococcus koreensis]WLF51843.1 ATP-binding cassette domain-containing protein [Rhodococcus opacus]WLF52360.1 ATP-binding cassette domain-containing protein [Rhodococcus opacus]
MDLISFVIIGLVAGSIYGLAAVGLVLTYKTSGVFNLGHGALAALAAYSFYVLNVQLELSWPIAAAGTVCAVGPAVGLLLELLARRLQGAALPLQIAGVVGILLVVQAGTLLIFGAQEVRRVPSFLPKGRIEIAGTFIQYDDVLTFVIAVVATAGLWAFLRWTRTGIAMKAVVQNPELLELVGHSATRVRRWAWILGTVMASLSGVLLAPIMPLDPVQLTLLVVAAYAAAAIGTFSNLPGTFAGGLVVGVLAALSTRWLTNGILASLPAALPFAILFVVLLFFPKKYLADKTAVRIHPRATWKAPVRLQATGGALVVAFLVTVPLFAGIHLVDWTVAVAMILVFGSLSLLVHTSGQVSLAQIGFMAIGAATFSHLLQGTGMSWPAALLLAGAVAVPIGAVLAVPAIRLGGLYLAIATFGFGIFLQQMFYTQDFMFGAASSGLEVRRPDTMIVDLASDTGYYYLVLAIAVVSVAVVFTLERGRLGRLLTYIKQSPRAAEANGVPAAVTRVLIFCITAFLAAIGGALAASAQQSISADSYAPIISLTVFVIIVLNGPAVPWNAVLAAAAYTLIPSYFPSTEVGTYLQLLFGISAIALVMLPPAQLPVRVTSLVDRWFRRDDRTEPALRTEPVDVEPIEPVVLEVSKVGVTFGGVKALDGADIVCTPGRVTGLIGPNGAGKSTLFNAVTGLVATSGGSVSLGGADLRGKSPSARARAGIGRTFQTVELFESMTVRDNVSVGAEGRTVRLDPITHLRSSKAERDRIRSATESALAACGLEDVADQHVMNLPTGTRRLVEVARCLAGGHTILLLDEPSAGLDHNESARLGELIRRVVDERGIGVILVEHDVSLVLGVSDDVYVLEFGRVIFSGSAADARRSSVVQAAYLGTTEPVDEVQSGRELEEIK